MKRSWRLAPLALVLAAALLLAACGGNAGGGQGAGDAQGTNNGGSGGASQQESNGGMAGMDHGEMGMGETTGGMRGMEGGSMGAREMVMVDGEYSDEAFIDAMVPHHRGAIEMAEVALDNAEHPEIRQLAEEIVTAQGDEIEELRRIKRQEFGTSEVPTEMSDAEMEAMGMEPADELANAEPFDKAFIDAMIPHHRSAIDMARVALEESENEEIRALASDIVDAQTREIRQLRQWRQQWYPEG